jgi:hypothetical protein
VPPNAVGPKHAEEGLPLSRHASQITLVTAGVESGGSASRYSTALVWRSVAGPPLLQLQTTHDLQLDDLAIKLHGADFLQQASKKGRVSRIGCSCLAKQLQVLCVELPLLTKSTPIVLM